MPPAVVLIENNFAYGAAVYQQLLWFVRHRQPPSGVATPPLDVIFATPNQGTHKPPLSRVRTERVSHGQVHHAATMETCTHPSAQSEGDEPPPISLCSKESDAPCPKPSSPCGTRWGGTPE